MTSSTKPVLSPQLATKQTLSPQIIQSQKILQTNIVEFADYINRQLNENPFLEEVESPTPDHQERFTDSLEATKFTHDYFQNELSRFSKNHHLSQSFSPTAADEIIAKTAKEKKKSLYEDLMEQLHLLPIKLNKVEIKIAETIIDYLDQDGFFDTSNLGLSHQIAFFYSVSVEKVDEILVLIQSLEPAGIATSNLRHSLLLQLDRLEKQIEINSKLNLKLPNETTNPSYKTSLPLRSIISAGKKIINEAFEELPKLFNSSNKKNYREMIQKKLKITDNNLTEALKQISLLNPKPASRYQEQYNFSITPDAWVIERNGKLEAIVNQELIPQIRLSQDQLNEWKSESRNTNSDFKKYLQTKEIDARWLIETITYRESNLMKILKKLIEIQDKFFRHGYDQLKPYTQVKFAKEIGLDSGSLSRLVNQKYIYTRWGLIPIRALFSSSIPTKNKTNRKSITGTISVSSEVFEVSMVKIKHIIQKLIDEFPEKKLSDQKITEILQQQGYQISRRTVNKYRNSLNLLSSYERRT